MADSYRPIVHQGRFRSAENIRDILIEFVRTDFKLRYQGSILGVLWVALKPMLMFALLYVVFSYRISEMTPGMLGEFFGVYLFCGLTLYYFFTEATNAGMKALLTRSGIILRTDFPLQIPIWAAFINSMISFAINAAILVVIAALEGAPIAWNTIWLFIPVVLVFSMLTVGLMYTLSMMAVRFTDIYSLWELVSRMLFFATPIFYHHSIVPSHVQWIFDINPLVPLVNTFRYALLGDSSLIHQWYVLVGWSVIAVVLFFVANRLYSSVTRRQLERL